MASMDMEQILLLAATRLRTRDGTAKAIRERAGLSASEVARLLGVSQPTVSNWENGKRVPRGEPAMKYAELLIELDRRSRAKAKRS
jgi:DNA-binding transcriptional regulator YiaG